MGECKHHFDIGKVDYVEKNASLFDISKVI